MALPGMDESSTRRSALPSVWPKPRSNGSMVTRAWRGATGCTFTTRGFKNSETDPCIAVSPCRLRMPAQTKTGGLGRGAGGRLLRIQLHHQVLVDVRQDIIATGRGLEDAAELLVVDLDPLGQAHLLGDADRALDAELLARFLPHLHGVARLHLVGRDGHRPGVDRDRLVADELPRLGAGSREAHAIDHIVQTALEQLQQILAGGAALAGRLLVVIAELALEHPVHAAQLLLLAQLRAVVGEALTPLALHAARRHAELA